MVDDFVSLPMQPPLHAGLSDIGHSLLTLLEQVERQTAQRIHEAEDRARGITEQAERRVGELEQQREELYQQISQVRVGDLLTLVRETQAEAIAKAEAAAMWQARAEMLAGELKKVCGELDGVRTAQAALPVPSNGPPAPSDSDELGDVEDAVDAEALKAKDQHITALQGLLDLQQKQLAHLHSTGDATAARARAAEQEAERWRRQAVRPWWARLTGR